MVTINRSRNDANEKMSSSKKRQRSFLNFILLQSPKKMFLISIVLVVLLHLGLLILQYDPTPHGRAEKWLRQRGLFRALQKTKRWRRGGSGSSGGGVVVFLHMKRTGGTSIRNNIANKPGFGIVSRHPHLMESSLAHDAADIERILSRNVTTTTTTTTKGGAPQQPQQQHVDDDETAEAAQIQFVTLHGDTSHLKQVRKTLEKWRKLAKLHKTTLFMFTVVRDPVDYHVSWFNQYRVAPCNRKDCIRPLLEPIPANVLQDVKANDQCRTLTHTPEDQYALVSEDDCNEAFDWMTKHLDWIGTTDALNTQTLPLLAELVLGDADRAETFQVMNAQEKTTKLLTSRVDYATASQIREKSKLDQQLYDKVKARYSL